jgi:hypothetical protein
MVTVVVFVASGVVLAALWSMAAGGWSVPIVLGSAAAMIVFAAFLRALRGPGGRAVSLALASFVSILFSLSFWSFRQPGADPGITINQVVLALGVALAILAVAEAIRAVMARNERDRAAAATNPDVGSV